MFKALPGGKKVAKVVLSCAYQQIVLEETSQQCMTISTFCGLYQTIHLPFRLSSAPDLIHKTMGTFVGGIPKVVCYIDDNLMTGADNEEHLKNHTEVLEH